MQSRNLLASFTIVQSKGLVLGGCHNLISSVVEAYPSYVFRPYIWSTRGVVHGGRGGNCFNRVFEYLRGFKFALKNGFRKGIHYSMRPYY
jgi:hypothetical protein